MTESTNNVSAERRRRTLLAFVLPLAVYMTVQSLEPAPATLADTAGMDDAAAAATAPDLLSDAEIEGEDFSDNGATSTWLGMTIPGKYYPLVYSVKVILTLAVVLWFLPVYLEWPVKVSPLAIGVGIAGGILWIACCYLDPTGHLVDWLGPDHTLVGLLGLGERAAYNPLSALARLPQATDSWQFVSLGWSCSCR